jgi:hypothetical protein
MTRTPRHLVQQFGMAPATTERAIPRALFAYGGPNKSRFLLTTIAATMAGALPEYGQKRTWRADVTQAEMAARCGLTRETFTRALSEVATPDDSWTVERRLQARARARQQHQGRGNRLHDRERPSRCHIATLIGRKRRFMRPNLYNFVLPERHDPDRPHIWFPPTSQEIRQTDELRTLFARLAVSDDGFRKFKRIPDWLWSPKLPLTWKARLVMTYYFMIGLGSPGKTKKVIWMVNPRQATVAEACGISVHTVYNANRELARMGLIRVAHPEPTVLPDGTYQRGPAWIIYLPIRQLSEEEAKFERSRFAFALMASGGGPGGWMGPRVKELHHALLGDWEGKEHCLRAFWNELRRRAIADGVHRRYLDNLVPFPPE